MTEQNLMTKKLQEKEASFEYVVPDFSPLLSYDIVKAHARELKVETKEGEGSEFIISLPLL